MKAKVLDTSLSNVFKLNYWPKIVSPEASPSAIVPHESFFCAQCAHGCITTHKVHNYTTKELGKPNVDHRQQRPYKVIKVWN